MRLIRAVFFLFLPVLANGVLAAPRQDPPNFVLILMDDMGYGDIGPFNPKTPNRTPQLGHR